MMNMFTQPEIKFTVGDYCKLSKVCTITDEKYEVEVDYVDLCLYNEGRELIQNVFPNLNPEQRDFIKFGCTPAEWDEKFK